MNRCRIVLILLALSAFVRPAQARNDPWVEVTSPHFKISSDAGEKEARRIARQCEEIRSVFLVDHPGLRVEGGRPLTVIAVKDEDALKVLLPDFWAVKDRVRPPGAFQSFSDEDFAVLRTNVSVSNGENPYYALYEAYVFSILRLNYGAMPMWLRMGIADYYGNTLIDDKYTEIGHPINSQIVLLQRSSPIPLLDLLNADGRSPLVNDRDKQPLFYAESWAIVHYLALSPDVAQQDLLNKYLKSWQETGDAAESARRSFGDLKAFEAKIDDYSRKLAFYSQRRPSAANFADKDYSVRALSEAEALVVQADFLQHTNHMPEAREMLKSALAAQPDLARVHECIAYDKFAQHDNDGAEAEFQQAFKLDPSRYRSLFYLAEITYRRSGYTAQSLPTMIQDLEAATQINPNFAPAYAFLSVAYREQPETKVKALDAALKAHQLEPAMFAYSVDIGDAMIALGRDTDARFVRDTLDKNATTPAEKNMAELYSKRLAHHEEAAEQKKQQGNSAQVSPASVTPAPQLPEDQPQP
jgi:cytochrome c-type biogenesis protein CcmH/NrfG